MGDLANGQPDGKSAIQDPPQNQASSASASPIGPPPRALLSATNRLSALKLDFGDHKADPSKGNAFAVMRTREAQGSRLPRKSTGCPSPTSPIEEECRPDMPRKVSSLDYNEELAMPMPKPHRSRGETPELEDDPEDEKKLPERPPSSWEFAPRCDSPACESISTTPESKKRSKFKLLKSKLSFKDLKKEAAREEISSPMPFLPSSENTKPSLRRPLNSAPTMPSISSTAYPPKEKQNVEQSKPTFTGSVSARSTCATNASTTASRIPLPPSNTLSHAQGVISTVSANASSSQRRTSVQRPPSYSSSASKEEKVVLDSTFGTLTPDTCERQPPDLVVKRTRMSAETPLKPFTVARSPLDPLTYPVTGDSPPRPDDLLEGAGKVKYIPKVWLEGPLPPTPSPQPKEKESAEPSGKGIEPRIVPISSLLPTFKERLEKANIPLHGSVNSQGRYTAMQVDEIVDIVRSIQCQADTGIESITNRLEEFSSWINDQLNHHIQSITDLSRANSDLLTKQSHISREIMQFQLGIRLEIGVMERHFNGFDMQLVDELQAEVRALAKSYEELNLKTDALLQGSSKDETKRFIEVQHLKNIEIESEIAFLKAQALRDCHLPHPTLPVPIPSESSMCSAEALIKKECLVKQADSSLKTASSPIKPKPKPKLEPEPEPLDMDAGILAIGATHPPMLPPRSPIKVSSLSIVTLSTADSKASEVRNREVTVEEAKPALVFPRSASLSKKGFLKSLRPGTPDLRDKVFPKLGTSNSYDSKKWSLFGFRRRHTATDNPFSGVTKGGSPPSHKSAKDQVKHPEKGRVSTSSRSSTPPLPPIPVQFTPKHKDKGSLDSTHPALRVAGPAPLTLPKRPQDVQSRGSELSSPGIVSTLSITTDQITPTACSSGGVLLPAASEMESSLVSVPETEVKASESDDDFEEQPLLGGDDGGNGWNYVTKTKTASLPSKF